MTPVEQADAASRRLAAAQAVVGWSHRARVARELLPPGTLWCSACQSVVPTFYASGTRCKADARAARRAAHVQKTYGLSSADEKALLRLQGGRCAICRQHQRKKALAVDHDHKTGVVRGLLCTSCNHDLLGAAHDDVLILRSAVAYMTDPPTSGRWVEPGLGDPDF